MNAGDVMTANVVTVGPATPIAEVVNTLLRQGISAVPVVDEQGAVLGVVSEGDLLRRAELGTEKHRSAWRASSPARRSWPASMCAATARWPRM